MYFPELYFPNVKVISKTHSVIFQFVVVVVVVFLLRLTGGAKNDNILLSVN